MEVTDYKFRSSLYVLGGCTENKITRYDSKLYINYRYGAHPVKQQNVIKYAQVKYEVKSGTMTRCFSNNTATDAARCLWQRKHNDLNLSTY